MLQLRPKAKPPKPAQPVRVTKKTPPVEFEVDAIVASKVERGRKLYRVRWVRRRRVFRFSFFRGGDREGKKAARREKCLTHSHPLSLPENKNSPLDTGGLQAQGRHLGARGMDRRQQSERGRERERERERARREERQGEKTHFRLFFFHRRNTKTKTGQPQEQHFVYSLAPEAQREEEVERAVSGERWRVVREGLEWSLEREILNERERAKPLCVFQKKDERVQTAGFFSFGRHF